MPRCRQQALHAAADAIAETAAWMQTHQFLSADELGVLGHLVSTSFHISLFWGQWRGY